MAEARFQQLRQRLLHAGVAPRRARRAVEEIESHFQQLIDEDTARGASENAARSEAHRRLGTNQELLRCYAERPELRAWSRRWPSICFTIVPLFTYLAIGFGTLLGVASVAELMGPSLHRVRIASDVTLQIDLIAQVVLLWCLPLCVTAVFGLLAGRRRVALGWSLACIVLVSVLASLCNVVVKFAGGPRPGEVGAGIGFSPESLPGQSMHAAVLAALSLGLLWTLRRARRERDLN